MRTLIAITTFLFLATGLASSAEAQLLNRLKKKAQDAAAQKAEEKLAEAVERKAEQMVEESWNSIFGEWEEGTGGEGRSPLFTMNSNVTTEDTYRFNTITTMEVEMTDKDGKKEPPMTMKMHFNDDAMYTGTRYESEEMRQENGDVFIIYDFKNSAMVMLMQSEEDKFSFAYDWQQALEQAEAYEDEPAEVTESDAAEGEAEAWGNYSKIGTKTIAGYNCEGYRSETENAVTEVWLSPEADFGMQRMFGANTNSKYLRGKVPTDYPQGTVMAMESQNLETGETITMQVVDIDRNANISYTMSDYPTMSIGAKQ